MSVDFSDIVAVCGGGEAVPGLAQRIYFAAKCDIDVWPALPAAPTTATTNVTIATNFTMVAGKVFHQLDIVEKSGNIKNSLQGVRGSRSYKGVLAFKLSGNSDAKESFDRLVKNGKFAVIAEENDGTQRLFGTEANPAYFESIEGDGGADPEKDGYETTYVLVAPVNVGFVPKFTGTIPLT